jgi:hypothetical protein
VSAYGFGLGMNEDPAIGRIAGHGGGYPGFGSFMRWHPATGTGVIAFGNSTYARMYLLTMEMLTALMGKPAGTAIALAPGQVPWPETVAAREAVNKLLTSGEWDGEAADGLFTPNVAQDAPYPERRRKIELIRDRIGDFRDADSAPEHDSPAHCRWRLAGERGTVQAQILLTPERPPRVQSLTLAVPPAPGSPLQAALDTIVAWMNAAGTPPAPVGGGLLATDGEMWRGLRAAAVWAGQCRPGAYVAGDDPATTTVELLGEHATLTLSVTIHPATGRLVSAEVQIP